MKNIWYIISGQRRRDRLEREREALEASLVERRAILQSNSLQRERKRSITADGGGGMGAPMNLSRSAEANDL